MLKFYLILKGLDPGLKYDNHVLRIDVEVACRPSDLDILNLSLCLFVVYDFIFTVKLNILVHGVFQYGQGSRK